MSDAEVRASIERLCARNVRCRWDYCLQHDDGFG